MKIETDTHTIACLLVQFDNLCQQGLEQYDPLNFLVLKEVFELIRNSKRTGEIYKYRLSPSQAYAIRELASQTTPCDAWTYAELIGLCNKIRFENDGKTDFTVARIG